jgi:phage terminase large subunit
METTPAFKEVIPGIQAVSARLQKAGDGKPRLFILRDSLVQEDERLQDLRKPASTAAEFEGYIWDQTAGKKRGEKPIETDNHGMDALRYMVYWRDRFEQDEGEPFVFYRRR